MQISNFGFVFALVSCAIAAPTQAGVEKRALTFQLYNDFQVSDGVGGDGLARVNKNFPIGTDFKAVSKADIDILGKARSTANDAEAEFLVQLEKAGGRFPDGSPLSVGMTLNKVLKLRTFEMLLQVQLAQGLRDEKAGTTQLEEVQKKLKKNVADDVANKGKPSQSVKFAGPAK